MLCLPIYELVESPFFASLGFTTHLCSGPKAAFLPPPPPFFLDLLRRQEELRRMEEMHNQEMQKRKEMQLR